MTFAASSGALFLLRELWMLSGSAPAAALASFGYLVAGALTKHPLIAA